MAKSKQFYLCTECGYKTAKWLGKCPSCANWNSFEEEVEQELPLSSTAVPLSALEAVSLPDVSYTDADRQHSGIPELDRVLGGLVPGQAVLISGEPGVGKSTLLLQLARHFAKKQKVYYINGEESNSQVKSRADRLGINEKDLYLLSTHDLENILEKMQADRPALCIVDSLQTLSSQRFSSLPGSIVQARECAFSLIQAAKTLNIPLFLVSHITKAGNIAGPKVVEHMVDTVLFLESDERGMYRVLRSIKNRFSSTDEVGFFTMESSGLQEIADLSHAFVNMHDKQVAGVSLFPYLEGNRAFPVEVQALCVPTQFNYPRRTADGIELNRLNMLLAILEKHFRLNYSAQDVFLNITGGLKINDPALDLAVVMALYSSLKNKALSPQAAFFGELGLAGELRPVKRREKRILELDRLGFREVYYSQAGTAGEKSTTARLFPLKTLEELITLLG